MHSWPLVLLVSGSALLFGTIKLIQRKNGKEVSLAFTAYVLVYGVVSSTIAIISVFVWHIHSITKFIIHFHPGNLGEIAIFEFGFFHIDLLSVLIVGLTFAFFFFAFIIAQIFLHIYIYLIDFEYSEQMKKEIAEFEWLSGMELVVVPDKNPDAFAFTSLTPRLGKPIIRDWVIITSGMLKLLDSDELETVLAHEVGHLSEEDTRYSHLLFTLSAIIFFDPILKFITSILKRTHEFEADLRSVTLTRKPRSLASALFKIIEFNHNWTKRISSSIFLNNSKLLKARIERLLELAGEME